MILNYKEALRYIQQNNLVYSFVILVSFFLMSKIFVYVCQKVILRLTKKTKTQLDDMIVKKTNRPISIILILIGIRLSLLPLGIKENILNILEEIILSIIMIVATYITVVVFDSVIDEWGLKFAEKTHSDLDTELISMFHRFSRIILSILGLLFILPLWGIQIAPLLASLGIAGLAVAFALQSTLGNIFGGVSILLDKSVKVGDVIRLDNETIGRVMDVGLRSTRINTFDNEVIIIPNGKLAESRILNYLQPDPRVRCVIEFGVEYGSDVDKVKKIVIDEVNSLSNVLKEPEENKSSVMFMEMGDFALKFKALFWVAKFDERFPTKEAALAKIYNALRKNGIGIPFPTRTVYLKEDKGKGK